MSKADEAKTVVIPRATLGAHARIAGARSGSGSANGNANASDSNFRPDVTVPNRHIKRRHSRKSPRHPFLAAFLWLITLGVLGMMALRYAPSAFSNGKLIPELASFVPHAAVVSLLILILAILWRRRALAAVSIACLVAQVVWHVGFFMPAPSIAAAAKQEVPAVATTEDNVVRMMTLNTAVGNASAQEIVDMVREQCVEVLALQEVTDQLLANLEAAGLYELLPNVVLGARTATDNGGVNGLWTLAPMDNTSQSLLNVTSSAAPGASIQVGQRTVRLVSVHPSSPRTGQHGFWNAGLQDIRSLAQYEHDYVILGDFNSTWDHSRFRKLLGTAFVDASQQAGEGFHSTWPSDPSYTTEMFSIPLPLPPVIEIDHIVYAKDSGLSVANLQTAKVAGTDHMALLGTLVAE